MSEKTSIEWTDATWNPIRGCSRISPGCGGAKGVGGCYAEAIAERFSGPGQPYAERGRGWTRKVSLLAEKLDTPLRWRRPRRIFVNSTSDLFHEGLPFEEIAAVFGVMAAAPQHTFQVLTKRSQRMREWFEWVDSRFAPSGGAPGARVHPFAVCTRAAETLSAHPALTSEANYKRRPVGGSLPWPVPNVWIGVSVEDQRRAEERIPHLLRVPAAVRFLSVEPQIEAIDLTPWLGTACRWLPSIDHSPRTCSNEAHYSRGVDWVIQGGESGRAPRPFDVAWMFSMQAQCKAAGVAWFPKQAGARPLYDGIPVDMDDSHGGNEDEWPTALRGCRAFPEVRP